MRSCPLQWFAVQALPTMRCVLWALRPFAAEALVEALAQLDMAHLEDRASHGLKSCVHLAVGVNANSCEEEPTTPGSRAGAAKTICLPVRLFWGSPRVR
mmetsp:Transcript_1783/g.3935  ORF Transcript_1783/g.3935 Transcript_1783/m.3935 type:complete len:99 (-) Transcript_1783:212-508(-)